MKRAALALCAGLMLLGLVPGAILAVAVVDAHSEDISYGWGGSPSATYAQTFTVGTTGKLTGVDLRLDSTLVTTTVDVNIEALDGSGNPDGTPLTSGSATVPTSTTWVNVALTPYSVTSGQVYALVFTLHGVTSGQWEVWGSIVNPYAGGMAMDGNNGWHVLQNSTTEDFAFRTYVDAAPAATPSPTPFQSFQGATAPIRSSTPPPTSTAPTGGAGTGSPALPLIVAGLATAAAFVIMRRYGFARR
jgi:hypothetical protein